MQEHTDQSSTRWRHLLRSGLLRLKNTGQWPEHPELRQRSWRPQTEQRRWLSASGLENQFNQHSCELLGSCGGGGEILSCDFKDSNKTQSTLDVWISLRAVDTPKKQTCYNVNALCHSGGCMVPLKIMNSWAHKRHNIWTSQQHTSMCLCTDPQQSVHEAWEVKLGVKKPLVWVVTRLQEPQTSPVSLCIIKMSTFALFSEAKAFRSPPSVWWQYSSQIPPPLG